MRGVMLAAPASGSGKTVVTMGLLAALKSRGIGLAAFKCGPDYIDPLFHRNVLQVDSCNLDSFFLPPDQVRGLAERTLAENAGPEGFGVVEGVMGYFDGLGGVSVRGSSCEMAEILDIPVILVVDGRGASLSLAALIQGFLNYVPTGGQGGRSRIAGVILNRVGAGMYGLLKKTIEAELPVKCLGYVPKMDWLKIESRHLGLVLPGEIDGLKSQVRRLREELETSLDWEGILALGAEGILRGTDRTSGEMERKAAESTGSVAGGGTLVGTEGSAGVGSFVSAEISVGIGDSEDAGSSAGIGDSVDAGSSAGIGSSEDAGNSVGIGSSAGAGNFAGVAGRTAGQPVDSASPAFRLAVAMDEAFCFYYQENLRALEAAGAELCYFSPIHDREIPGQTDGLLLGGGYPELHAGELAGNSGMRESIRRAAERGMPLLAECGGYLYLLEELEGADGAVYPMAGVFAGAGHREDKLRQFGYITVSAESSGLYLEQGESVRGHEFHYWHCPLDREQAVMKAAKPVGRRSWPAMRRYRRVLAGFPHLYYLSCPELVRRFAEQCVQYREEKDRKLVKIDADIAESD